MKLFKILLVVLTLIAVTWHYNANASEVNPTTDTIEYGEFCDGWG